MVVKQLLDKKREGRALGSAEIRELVEGFTCGGVPDYQMSAFAMAVCCRGMTARETADLTDAMRRSGAQLDWGEGAPTADKHSTGGVGDKLSLVIQPLAAACGLRVPSLTGRGLGLTGGTADKLESIPGYNAALTLDRFREVVDAVGVSMTVQTDEICPADKKLYALRDVTGTVASMPLITASILSKKLAEGAGTLVFDVKCGAGAFMKDADEATELARMLVRGAKDAGRRAVALVTDMNAPLGRAVGNANEVAEALDILSGAASPLTALCVEFAARMVSRAEGAPLDAARQRAQERLADGSALAKFRAMVAAHGGDLEAFGRLRETARVHRFRVSAMRSGFVSAIDARAVAQVALELGAGRVVAGERIDALAGVTLDASVGDRVAVGQPLATLETATRPERLESAAAALLKAVRVTGEPPAPVNPILREVTEND